MKHEKTAPRELRIAVLGSGRGSNFGSIADGIRNGTIPNTKIVVVISNNSRAGILNRAREHGIPAMHLSEGQFPGAGAYVSAFLRELRRYDVNFIVLAGYMKRIPEAIVDTFRNRIINIHPALLPKFGGKGMFGENVHRAVLESGETESGATVHLVDEEYDRGPIVLQRKVPVLGSDTVETLAHRVLAVEHEIYPDAIRLFAEGRVSFDQQESVVQHH